MKNLTKYFLVVSVLLASSVFAASALSPAKNAGIIGEQANGYIGFVKTASADVKALVKSVNNKRKARYKKIAISKKISINDVAKIGGKKAIEKTATGNYIKRAGEGWSKK